MLTVDSEILRDLAAASRREWLLTDGLGGYASSTVIGLNTRRYHGLLVVATKPPVGRMVLLSRVEEGLIVDGRRLDLATNHYPGAVHPRGFERAVRFVLDPLPTLTWEVEGGRLSRTVARVHEEPAVVLQYVYEGHRPATLEVRPLLAYRDHHGLQRENAAWSRDVLRAGEDVVLRPYAGCPFLHLRLSGGRWETDGCWYYRFQYEREQERGLDSEEDLHSPGVFRLHFEPGACAALLAWAGPIPAGTDPLRLLEEERRRLTAMGLAGERSGIAAPLPCAEPCSSASLALGRHSRGASGGVRGGDATQRPPLNVEAGGSPLVQSLRRAADAFLVRRGEAGRSIIAGYHWFSDWGRDTMIALSGLCLSAGRLDEARAILSEFSRHVDRGMIPNRFPDDGEAACYNTVDAPLWFVIAAHSTVEATGDPDVVGPHLKDAVFAILDGYRAGTRHGIRMTPDGLITQGEPGLQLTWMDAKVGSLVVTPRRGLAVEIQALWYNALRMGAEMAQLWDEGPRASEWTRLAERASESFLRNFWSEDLGYLADVVGGGTRDLSLRPNQLYAIGLPHALLPRDKALRVLDAVKRHLLTPVGLRTLAPSDTAYRGRYDGDPTSRDTAYHQGTVWPYLIGVYFDAAMRFRGEEGRQEARDFLRAFTSHLEEAGLGTASEVFDGDPPHRPGGAIAQAWSVAELLRIAEQVGA